MEFSELLKQYIAELGITQKRLARACGMKLPTLNRYINGQRLPEGDSFVYKDMASAIAELYREKGIDISKEEIFNSLVSSANYFRVSNDDLVDNINFLMDIFEIKSSNLAKYLHYTQSHFSNIRMHRRSFKDPRIAAGNVARYIADFAADGSGADKLERLVRGAKSPAPVVEKLLRMKPESLQHYVHDLFSQPDAPSFDSFLWNREIDILDYARSDKLSSTKCFIGKTAIDKARLIFISLNKSLTKEDRLFINDFEFYPSHENYIAWQTMSTILLLLNSLLRRGVKVDKICNISRSHESLSRFFEFWLPLVFCGDITFFWNSFTESAPFRQVFLLSDKCLLSGNFFPEEPTLGRVVLTQNKDTVKYYMREAAFVRDRCTPVFQIEDRCDNYKATLRIFRGNPPQHRVEIVDNIALLVGMSEELLQSIADRAGIPANVLSEVRQHIGRIRDCVELLDEKYLATFYFLHRDTAADKIPLPLYTNKFGGDAYFTADEYSQICDHFEAYAAKHPNMSIQYIEPKVFKHLRFIFTDNWTLVTEDKIESKQVLIKDRQMEDAIKSLVL